MQGTIYNNFPAFGCDWARVGPESAPIQVVLLSGGGGATKSGIKNQIQLCRPGIGADGKASLDELSSFRTGDLVPSSVVFSRDGALVVASVDEYEETKVDDGKGGEKVKRTSRGGAKLLKLLVEGESAKLIELGYFRTDWAEEDSTMAVARFNTNASELATGGEDGTVRLWGIAAASKDGAKGIEGGEELGETKRLELTGHKEPVVDLDWSPKSDLLVSVSKDSTARVWRVKDGKLLAEATAQSGGTRNKKTIGKDCFRAARFFEVEGGGSPGGDGKAKKELRLLATMCPQRGDTHVVEFAVTGSAAAGDVALAPLRTVRLCDHSAAPRALRLSLDGAHVGIGTNGGNMYTLDRASLATVARKEEACGLPVTMVAFSPPSAEPNILFGCSPDRTCYVLSTAGANTVLLLVLALVVLALLAYQFAM